MFPNWFLRTFLCPRSLLFVEGIRGRLKGNILENQLSFLGALPGLGNVRSGRPSLRRRTRRMRRLSLRNPPSPSSRRRRGARRGGHGSCSFFLFGSGGFLCLGLTRKRRASKVSFTKSKKDSVLAAPWKEVKRKPLPLLPFFWGCLFPSFGDIPRARTVCVWCSRETERGSTLHRLVAGRWFVPVSASLSASWLRLESGFGFMQFRSFG